MPLMEKQKSFASVEVFRAGASVFHRVARRIHLRISILSACPAPSSS
jgi:hypothetical protein